MAEHIFRLCDTFSGNIFYHICMKCVKNQHGDVGLVSEAQLGNLLRQVQIVDSSKMGKSWIEQ